MYFHLQSLTNDLENRDFWSKFDHFETSFLTIFGVKKVLFPVFSKVFWSCSGSAWALFLIEMSSFGFTFSYKVCFPYFPITKFLLWGPAKPYKTSTRLSSATSCAVVVVVEGRIYLLVLLTMLGRFFSSF